MHWTLLSLVKVSLWVLLPKAQRREEVTQGKEKIPSPLPLNSETVGKGRQKCSDPQRLPSHLFTTPFRQSPEDLTVTSTCVWSSKEGNRQSPVLGARQKEKCASTDKGTDLGSAPHPWGQESELGKWQQEAKREVSLCWGQVLQSLCLGAWGEGAWTRRVLGESRDCFKQGFRLEPQRQNHKVQVVGPLHGWFPKYGLCNRPSICRHRQF